jgi:hypothetical protein
MGTIGIEVDSSEIENSITAESASLAKELLYDPLLTAFGNNHGYLDTSRK